MTGKTIIVTLALLLSATSMTLAQSQRNYGPNGPSRYNCFGEPYSGTVASRCPGQGGGYPSRYWRHYW